MHLKRELIFFVLVRVNYDAVESGVFLHTVNNFIEIPVLLS